MYQSLSHTCVLLQKSATMYIPINRESSQNRCINRTSVCVCVCVQSANNLLNRYQGSDTNLYQRNLEAQALLAQQQVLGMGIQGLSSQTALDLLQVSCTTCCGWQCVCCCWLSGCHYAVSWFCVLCSCCTETCIPNAALHRSRLF